MHEYIPAKIHPLMRTVQKKNHSATLLIQPLPPPTPPPIRHMTWSMFGSGELLATITEKTKTTALSLRNADVWICRRLSLLRSRFQHPHRGPFLIHATWTSNWKKKKKGASAPHLLGEETKVCGAVWPLRSQQQPWNGVWHLGPKKKSYLKHWQKYIK